MYMIRLFVSIFVVIFLSASAVISSAGALDVHSCCCCSDTEISTSAGASITNDCCCAPTPGHKLPTKSTQIETKPSYPDLQITKLFVLLQNKQSKIAITIDNRRPLHLASNELYLKKRALLI